MRGSRAFEMSMNRAASNLWGARSLVTRLERVGTGARWRGGGGTSNPSLTPQSPPTRRQRPREECQRFLAKVCLADQRGILSQQNYLGHSLARTHTNDTVTDWARDWRALALTQVHHLSRQSDSCEGGTRSPAARNRRGRSTRFVRNVSLDPPSPR